MKHQCKGGGFRKSGMERRGKGRRRGETSEAQSLCVSERKEEDVKGKSRKRNESPKAKQLLGRSGRWLFLLLNLMQSWFCVDAAAGRLEPKGGAEVPEIIIVSDAVEGTFVNFDGGRAPEKMEANKRK